MFNEEQPTPDPTPDAAPDVSFSVANFQRWILVGLSCFCVEAY